MERHVRAPPTSARASLNMARLQERLSREPGPAAINTPLEKREKVAPHMKFMSGTEEAVSAAGARAAEREGNVRGAYIYPCPVPCEGCWESLHSGNF